MCNRSRSPPPPTPGLSECAGPTQAPAGCSKRQQSSCQRRVSLNAQYLFSVCIFTVGPAPAVMSAWRYARRAATSRAAQPSWQISKAPGRLAQTITNLTHPVHPGRHGGNPKALAQFFSEMTAILFNQAVIRTGPFVQESAEYLFNFLFAQLCCR